MAARPRPQLRWERKGSHLGGGPESALWVLGFLSRTVPSFTSHPRREEPSSGALTHTPHLLAGFPRLDWHLLPRPLIGKKPESLWL